MYVIDRMDHDLHEDRITISETLFLDVRKRYGGLYSAPISVISENGLLCFNLVWESDFLTVEDRGYGDVCVPYCNYYGEDLLEEEHVLDFSFVDRYEVIRFERIDEFSWQIIRLLNQTRQQLMLSTDDPMADYFKELTFLPVRQCRAPRSLTIKHERIMRDMRAGCSIYSLMISLTWARLRHFNPKAEHPETVLRIDPALVIQGFGDIFKFVSCYVSMAKAHGWIPVICLDHGCQFEDEKGEDCWAKFFDPISTIHPGEIDKYAEWISVYENRHAESICEAGCCNPYLNSFLSEMTCSFDFSINKKTEKKIEEFAGSIIEASGHAFGVVIRTTDFDWLNKKETSEVQLLRKSGVLARTYSMERVFLATEEEAVLDQAKKELGERLLFVPQRRVSNYRGGFLSYVLGDTYDSKYRFGVEYLAVIASLARCDVILYNRMCGAIYVATALRRSRGKESATMIDARLADIFMAVGGAERVFIYGAAVNGRMLCVLLMHQAEVVFCDRKAEKGEYRECGCRVISPEMLAVEYTGEPVIVTPVRERQEIVDMLESLGVPQSCICQFNPDESFLTDTVQKSSSIGKQSGDAERSVHNTLYTLTKNVEPGKHIYIYGAGLRGEMAYEILSGRQSITFCDKRANGGEYTLFGCRVISPDTLAKIYQGEFVVVTPQIGRFDVFETLRKNGIPEEKIVVFLP